MTQRKIKYIDGSSPEYWRKRSEGFHLIREAERALVSVKNAPQYIAGQWDEDYGDYEPVENLGPYDDMDGRSELSRPMGRPSTFSLPIAGPISVTGPSQPSSANLLATE